MVCYANNKKSADFCPRIPLFFSFPFTGRWRLRHRPFLFFERRKIGGIFRFRYFRYFILFSFRRFSHDCFLRKKYIPRFPFLFLKQQTKQVAFPFVHGTRSYTQKLGTQFFRHHTAFPRQFRKHQLTQGFT